MSQQVPVETPAEGPATPNRVDEAAIERMHAVVRLLDDGFELPVLGVRVGLDPILGVLPIAGDSVATVIGLYIVAESARLGVSYGTIARQLLNIAVDLCIGSIPAVGDVFDLTFRSNRRNLYLALEDLGVDMELEQ